MKWYLRLFKIQWLQFYREAFLKRFLLNNANNVLNAAFFIFLYPPARVCSTHCPSVKYSHPSCIQNFLQVDARWGIYVYFTHYFLLHARKFSLHTSTLCTQLQKRYFYALRGCHSCTITDWAIDTVSNLLKIKYE